MPGWYCVCHNVAFSALTLLVGRQEEHPVCKIIEWWGGYLSGVRCKWFAYGPADATVTPSSLASLKSRLVYVSGTGLPRLSWKESVKRMCCLVFVTVKSKSATLSHSASSAAVFCRKVSHSLIFLAPMLLTRYVLEAGVITGISAVVTVLCIWYI